MGRDFLGPDTGAHAMTQHAHAGVLDQVHIALALGIAAAYIIVPFTALHRLPVTHVTQISGSLFFATCAITHLSIACGFHGSHWLVLADAVQLVSITVFVVSLNRIVTAAFERRRVRRGERGQP